MDREYTAHVPASAQPLAREAMMDKVKNFTADVVWDIGSMWCRLGRGFQLVGGWIQHQSFKIAKD